MQRVTLAVVVTDLGVKAAVAALIPAGHSMGPVTSTSNPRFMLGVAGTDTAVMVALMVLGVAAASVVATRLLDRGRIPATAAGLAIGGAVANTIDRALHGAVTDFLIIGPVVVNLADLAVLLGLICTAAALSRPAANAAEPTAPHVASQSGRR